MGQNIEGPAFNNLDRPTDEEFRRLLDGEMPLDMFCQRHNLSGGPMESKARILHILNITYKAVQSEQAVAKAIEYLGSNGDILHIPAEDPSMSYRTAVQKKGRLLTPQEYGGMVGSFEGLKILYAEAVKSKDRKVVQALVEKARAMIPNKAHVLARMNEYPYEKVLVEFAKEAGSPELVSPDEFMDFVASRVSDLEAKEECQLQLTREPTQLDHLLVNLELQRTPETREELTRQIIATSPKFFFTQGSNLRSKAVYESYPDDFRFEDMARSTVKWKCEGDCTGCINWRKSLVKKSHSYSKW